MLIICKHLEHHIYDDIQTNINKIYGFDTSYNDDIIMNAIPIKYNDNYYIFANLAKLEISALSLRKKSYNIEYIIDKDLRGEININNVFSVHEITSKISPNNGDCFYDEHLNIMFIKFQDIRIEYIDIKLNTLTFKKLYELNNININFKWSNNLLENKTIGSYDNQLFFQDDFIDLPTLPMLSSNSQLINDLTDNELIKYPCTGASVFNDANDFIGMVSYSDRETIITIHVFFIKKALDYLNYKPLYKYNFIMQPIQINYLYDLKSDYGLYYKKKIDKYTKTYNYDIIMSIDEYLISSNGNLKINKIEIPLFTYMWLNVDNETIKIKSIKKNILKDTRIYKDFITDKEHIYKINLKAEREEITFNINEIKINNKFIKSFSVSNLNFIKYKDNILLELNEKIMQILKPIIQTTDNLDYLYDYVIKKNKYNEKIILIINNRMNIKLIDKINNIKIKSIDDVFKILKSKKQIRFFIEKN